MQIETATNQNIYAEEFSDTILPWYRFERSAAERDYSLPATITDDNRLICQTENFFVISGLGAFVPGYVLLIPKDAKYLSFASLPQKYYAEFRWLAVNLSKIISSTYNKIINSYYKTRNITYVESVIFEHGLVLGQLSCACTKQAHLHLMIKPCQEMVTKVIDWYNLTSNLSNNQLWSISGDQEYIINQVVNQRIKNYLGVLCSDFEASLNLQDLREYQESLDLNVSLDNYPQSAYHLLNQEQPYVFFWTQNTSLRFICSANLVGKYQPKKLSKYLKTLSLHHLEEIPLGSQFGREIVANFWNIKEPFWDWRYITGYENMLRTMLDIAQSLSSLVSQSQAQLYGYQNCIQLLLS